jgi:LacI family transcriptional regulator
MITARDVAQALGVSVSTVGRALANDSRISSQTRARVHEAASRLGYIENAAARVMGGARSRLIGLMLPDIRNDFYAQIAEAFSTICGLEGYQLVFSISNERDVELRHVRELIGVRAAGIVIVPTSAPRRETASLLRGQPHVQLLRRLPASTSAWFGVNDEGCVREATSFLLSLGHRRIAYIGGPLALSTGQARLAGFRNAFSGKAARGQAIEVLGPPSVEFGREAAHRLMNRKTRPTALMLGSVQGTRGALEALDELGIAVPQDLSVVGFGDASGFGWWRSGLTTLRFPIVDLATSCAVWFLNALKQGGPIAYEGQSTVSARLVERGSTARISA